jgi:hypothetical protein
MGATQFANSIQIWGDLFATERTEATEPLTEGEERNAEECRPGFFSLFFFDFLRALCVLCGKSLFAPNLQQAPRGDG